MSNGIIVLAEHLKGELTEITYEMLGIGRKLADELQAPLTAFVLGGGVGGLAAKLGRADKVLAADNAALDLAPAGTVAAALQQIMDQTQAAIVLVGGTNVALGVGTVLAQRTGLPFVNFCRTVKAEAGSVTATSQLFGGKILSDTKLEGSRGILSIYPGAYPADAGKSAQSPPVESVTLAVEAPKVGFSRFIEPETGDVDITKQDLLVAVGRGIQSQDNVALAEDLAAALGGAVCASRPVIDQGWLPLSRQVGKSGMSVKPRLYLALGISGAPEHWEGMQGSRLIVAVNTDPKAPIFDGAQYGTTVDALDLIPALIDKVKARKS